MAINKQIPPLVFFGTGPVAAKSLELLASHFKIEAVITKPHASHHKGTMPVLDIAENLGIKVLTTTSKQELDQLFESNPVKSELAILIDFGILVSQKIIDYFPLGIVNSHFSVLPDLRGADPITFSILSGQEKTGVSLMLLVEAMDEGPLFGYGEYTLPKDINGPDLTDILIDLSDNLLLDEIPRIINRQSVSAPQSVTKRKTSYSRKLNKSDGLLNWEKPAEVLEREIRAYLGWPGSRTKLGEIDVIVTLAHVVTGEGTPGKILIEKENLGIQTSNGRLYVDRLKPIGKKEMPIEAFLLGYRSKL